MAEKYIQAVGRRKTSVARVRLTPASKNSLTVNDKSLESYFPVANHQVKALEALKHIKDTFSITAKVVGGGIASQAESIRLGIARAIISLEPELRKTVKAAGFLKRDPRQKERRKFGLKKARKSPQWSKR